MKQAAITVKNGNCEFSNNDRSSTPDYKNTNVEIEWKKTCYVPFWPLKDSNFKNMVFKILDVSSCDASAK